MAPQDYLKMRKELVLLILLGNIFQVKEKELIANYTKNNFA